MTDFDKAQLDEAERERQTTILRRLRALLPEGYAASWGELRRVSEELWEEILCLVLYVPREKWEDVRNAAIATENRETWVGELPVALPFDLGLAPDGTFDGYRIWFCTHPPPRRNCA